MKYLYVVLVLVTVGLFGCGGGGGGSGQPVNVEGKWVGPMDLNVNGKVSHFGTSFDLSQQGSHVTGHMTLEYGSDHPHWGRIDGEMQGNHFVGTRSIIHVVDIEFWVNGNTLTGTFTFVSPAENLDEHGTYVCTRG